jgi:hypothetical protein
MISPQSTFRIICVALFFAPDQGFGATGSGDGDLWVADTSDSATLQTQIIPLSPLLTLDNKVRYEFGFATLEEPGLGFLFDSLTVSLGKADGSASANIVTGDVFGLTIAPLSPNGFLSGGGVTAIETEPKISLIANAPVSFAYSIEVSLPESLVGTELKTTFNFFNNGDAVETKAYAAVIPEPPVGALVALGVGLAALIRKGRKQS